jgi:hypothetical protein
LPVGEHQALLVGAVHVDIVNHRTGPLDGHLEQLLVDVLGVLGGLLQKSPVADLLDVGLLGAKRPVVEVALVDEVAAERVLVAAGQSAV